MKVVVISAVLMVAASAQAETPSWLWPKSEDPATAEAAPVADDGIALPHETGPKLVDLGSSVRLDLPAGYVMFSAATARAMLEKYGENSEGVIAVAMKPGADWSVTYVYDGVGYVSDDEADALDANELLTQLRAGTIAQNKTRVAKGVPELFVDDWTAKPHYEATSHLLQWGVAAHDKDGKVLNEFTRVLGRNGIVSINLIATPEELPVARKDAAPLIAGLTFLPGATYADHKDGDRDSGMGLSGLVLGGAGVGLAAKTGVIASILLALKKGIIAIAAAIGGFFKWITGKKKKVVVVDPPPSEPR